MRNSYTIVVIDKRYKGQLYLVYTCYIVINRNFV